MNFNELITNKSIAITGGAGSVGQVAARKLIDGGVNVLRIIDNNEALLFEMEQEYTGVSNIEFYCCDVSDESELTRCFSNIDYVFHMAALKHVPICERSPFSAVNVNIRGTETVIRAAVHSGVRRVLFTSTDKAVNPTNVMGTSKLMGERLFTAANSMGGREGERPIFASTRFGNVAGTRGSVIPLFANQIAKGGPVTVTDERMTRFVMTQSRAAELVIESICHAQGGEVFITKMSALNVIDLAKVMIKLIAPIYGRDPTSIELRIVGSRPGEKLWEELSTDEESARIFEGTEYLVVKPPFEPITHEQARELYPTLNLRDSSMTYHSEHVERMSEDEIIGFLMEPEVLESDLRARIGASAARKPAVRKEAV